MEAYFSDTARRLYNMSKDIAGSNLRREDKKENALITVPESFQREFFDLVAQVNLNLLEDVDNFYGYFLFHMTREIRFDIGGPTAVNFRNAGYVIYFNPLVFLKLELRQMEASIKHEILHILSLHLIRAKDFKGSSSISAINMAMDIAVNRHLKNLPRYATTLEWVNAEFGLRLKANETFEAYLEQIQKAMDSLEAEDGEKPDDTQQDPEPHNKNEDAQHEDDVAYVDAADGDEVKENDIKIETEYSIDKTHELWAESDEIDEKTLQEFTQKVIRDAEKGAIPAYLGGILAELKHAQGELPWNLYLKRLMGTIEGDIKKTVTRRNRRQPERLELRGQLRDHKAKVLVALDISGSITEEEFRQAIKEVLTIVRNYKHEITVLECDDEIRSKYQVKSDKDIRDRNPKRGGTRFEPVFEYANHSRINLLIYFTDGKGEEKLKVIPQGYHVLWVISGRGDKLSLKEPYGAVKKLKPIEAVDTGPDVNDGPRSGFSMMNQEK